jgi:hypothetical protein
MYASGNFTQKVLAAHFGIDQTMVSKIILRRYWKHIP